MKKLFIAMPYGKRKAPLDYEEPGTTCEIDFDAVWKKMLKPAVPTGFEMKRADELRRPGLIDLMYNEWLFDADIVLADLTFGNPNVYYELGIRQALSKKGTVLVACEGTKLPFDVRNQNVILYNYFVAHTLPDFQDELGQAIENACEQKIDSPVHFFLPGLLVRRYAEGEKPPEAKVQELTQRIQELDAFLKDQRSRDDVERLLDKIRDATTTPRLLSLYQLISAHHTKSVRLLEHLAISLRSAGHFDEALLTLNRALEIDPDDPELLREVGFVYRKKGPSYYSQAEAYMERALQLNDFDSELHGMLGGLYRRQGEYERALAEYRRAHELAPEDLYPLVTIGAMCAALGHLGEAKKWYQKLQATCEKKIGQQRADHWTYLCLGEAAVALGDKKAANDAYQKAVDASPPVEDVRSEAEHLEFLADKNFATEIARSVVSILYQYLESHGS